MRISISGYFCITVASALVALASAYSAYNDTITCQNPSVAESVTEVQVLQHGQCLPYQKGDERRPAVCDEFYAQQVDKFFLPYGRFRNDAARLIQFTADVVNVIDILQIQEPCKNAAKRILCYYYLPYCGNVTNFVPPSSLCMPVCEHVLSTGGICQREWSDALQVFDQYTDFLTMWQVDVLNCSRPSVPLQKLPHCCSDVGIKTYNVNITAAPTMYSITELSSHQGGPVTLASSVAVASAVFIILLIILVVVITVAVARYKHSKVSVLHVYGNHLDIHESPSSATLQTTGCDDMNGSHHRYITTMYQEHQRQSSVINGKRENRVASCYIKEMSEASLLIPQEQLKLFDRIGQGEFGVVYKGNLNGDWNEVKDSSIVAVKTLKASNFSTKDISNLIKESLKMKSFHHPNVLHLIGVCIDAGAAPYLVMPYMLNGSLLSYLRKERPKLTIVEGATEDLVIEAKKRLLAMCLQIAKGMEYLAEQKFIHRDLAARNCMIDENLMIKVSDFGLSESIYCKDYFRQVLTKDDKDNEGIIKLPVKWMALESLKDGIFTEKTDVWSFGVTCWEVFSLGRSPYPGVDPFTLIKYLEEGKRLDKPNNAACTENVYDVISNCWKKQPEKRPSFAELVVTLTSLLEDIAASVLANNEQAVNYDHLYAKPPTESQSGYDHLKPVH